VIESPWLELLRPLGVAIPLVAILFYLLRQATDERRGITSDFLLTLRETIKSGAEQGAQVTSQLRSVASEVSALNAETQERREAASNEHREMMNVLARILASVEAQGPQKRAYEGAP